MGNIANVKIEPMNVTWGEDVAQVSTVTTRADVSSDLQNDYFYLYSALNAVKNYVWFNVGGAGVDPAPAGATGVMVAISANATAAAVAVAVQGAVDALADYVATVSSNVVTITNAAVGYASAPHEGVGTNFTFAVTVLGDSAADVGCIDGDIEWSMTPDLVDVTCHQHGTNVRSHIITGKQVELTMTFKESTISQLRKAFVMGAGGSFTPAGAAGTEVFGLGQYLDFTQTYAKAKKLVMHPVVLGSGDKSRDVTFHKVWPMLDALTFSGENIFNIPLTFKVYQDESKHDRVEYFAIGDGSQTLT